MVRAAGLLLLIVGLAGVALLAPRWLEDRPNTESVTSPDDICRPLAEDCHWQTGSGTATLSMVAGEGDELVLTLNLPGSRARPAVVLTGESMYMGEYPLALTRTDGMDGYRVLFVPPFCSTGNDMVWRVELRDGQRSLDLPFRILFSPAEAGPAPA